MKNTHRFKHFLVAGAACLALAIPAAASAAIFLQLDPVNIKGESTTPPYENWINVESWSWGLSRSAINTAMGGARVGSKLCASEIAIQKVFDKSSPAIMTNMVGGKILPKVKLVFTRFNGDGQVEYLAIELSNVLITSYQVSGSGDERPFDSVSLNFMTAKVTYTPQDETGKGGTPVVSTVTDAC